MLKVGAQLISGVFYPLLLPTVAVIGISIINPLVFAGYDDVDRLKLLTTIFFNTFLLPVVTIVLMRKLGFIKSIRLEDREERIIPYIAMSIFYFWTFMVVKSFGTNGLIVGVLLGATATVFATSFFNLFFKISVHAAGAGSMVAIALFLAMNSRVNLEVLLMSIILVAGLIGSSRLYLKAHSSNQVFFGYFVGFTAQMTAFNFV